MKINSQYEVKITEDGSPTLILSTDGDHLFVEEKMHSLGGAAAETEYIYGPAIEWAFEKVKVPSFIVVGLGLGYIEYLIARQALVRKAFYEIRSFETEEFLKQSMLSWLHEEEPNALHPVLNSALNAIGGPDSQKVKEELRTLHENGKWRILGGITAEAVAGKRLGNPGHAILYDLFSHKITPELWSEEFLFSFLKEMSAPDCSFATYAAKGAIKKSLKNSGFDLIEKKGFGHKRESTLAFKSTHHEGLNS